MGVLRTVANFVFGMECLGCGSSSEKLDPWLCPACAAELARESCSSKFPNDDTFCLFPMRPLTRKLVHALKYRNIPGLASYLVRHSSAVKHGVVAQELSMLAQPLYFVPVPLHRARYRERGYNQAELLAAALATVTGGSVCRWLKRKTFVVSQTKLSKEERELNVAGAFVPDFPRAMPARGSVVVVDDVFTTGATTSACMAAFGADFKISLKVCTLLYDEPASAAADFAADCRADWDGFRSRR
ncbi:ComF family protein [Fibrobacter sp. UBA4297]|uniref:ComF family protein n=1 Tax=Fibrobacter sp. UBA4297 TaxID=1946536 RepID=UPI0025BB7294|nr:ComF family protein [Fibrobacter sp. UBA4297]